MGSEFSGDPSFYGEGLWIRYDGGQDPVVVGMRKDSKDLTFPPAQNYSPPPLNSTGLEALSIDRNFRQAGAAGNRAKLEALLDYHLSEGR